MSVQGDFQNKSNSQAQDPMVHVGRFRVRCNVCGEFFTTGLRGLRFCKTCTGAKAPAGN